MNFSGFYGNEAIKAVLSSHFFHAYLLEGGDGSGKHFLARLLTNALVCDADNPPCGVCNQCYKIRQECHPDVIRIDPTAPIDELRRILAGLPLKPNDANRKVYLVDGAEKRLPAAQNLLLKSLEEPPESVVFILICNTREGVLPTVRSRCQVLTLAPLDEATLERHFRDTYGTFDEKAHRAVELSAGYLGKALERYESGEVKESERAEQVQIAWERADAAELFRLISFSDREEMQAFYRAFSLRIKHAMRNASDKDRSAYAALSRALDECSPAMQTNVNVRFWNTNLARICLKNSAPHSGK